MAQNQQGPEVPECTQPHVVLAALRVGLRNINLSITDIQTYQVLSKEVTSYAAIFGHTNDAMVVGAICRFRTDLDFSDAFTFMIGGQLKRGYIERFSGLEKPFPNFPREIDGLENRINTYGAFCLRHDPKILIPAPTPRAQIERGIQSGAEHIEAFNRVFGRYLMRTFEHRPAHCLAGQEGEIPLSDDDLLKFDRAWCDAISPVANAELQAMLASATA